MNSSRRWRLFSALLLALSVASNISLTWFLYKNWLMLRLIACLVAGEDMLRCLK